MKAVDLFAGCGGLSLGLKMAGIDVVAAFENWENAIKVYELNFNHPIYNVDLSDEKKAIKIIKGIKPFIIVGGPPCQDFSSAGKRDENLGRADLTLSFAKIVLSCIPEVFIMENVDLASKSKVFSSAKELLSGKYGLTQRIIDASYCGVPQKRKRVFLIGKRNESDGFLNKHIDSLLSKQPMSVKKYLNGSINTEFYYRHPRSYSRRAIFSVNEPSPTIRGVNRPIPPNYEIHEGDAVSDITKVRPLTTHERSLIQTFPPNFKWGNFNKSVLEQMIGNAVPVKLGEFIGKALIKYFKDQEPSK